MKKENEATVQNRQFSRKYQRHGIRINETKNEVCKFTNCSRFNIIDHTNK